MKTETLQYDTKYAVKIDDYYIFNLEFPLEGDDIKNVLKNSAWFTGRYNENFKVAEEQVVKFNHGQTTTYTIVNPKTGKTIELIKGRIK